ncbi:hypothetical protein GYMLUDRAFT_731990 [Collybiopsis luxurians FD-317 M1]|nr:hypothetical protein GYMLUDRAFT_731990 [Collybiopsis luxurians FD-317 M1]
MARLTVFLLLASLPSSIFANEFSLSARDTTSSQTTLSAPETLFVPINFDARNRRYTVKVSLPNGSSPDLASYNFALTTSTGYSSVTGNECSTCEASPTFSIPSSAQPESQQIISLPEGDFVGPTITQTFNLELQNGSVWSWIDQSCK